MISLELLGIISGLLSAVMYFPYIRDILSGSTKPQRASWLIWTVLGVMAFFSQISKGATNSLWLPGIQTLGVFLVFSLSIKYGTGGLNRQDIISLILAGFGLVLWYLTNDSIYALILAILIDAIGGYLTVIKSYADPASETLITWVLSGTSGIFAAVSVGSLNAVLLAYPIYIVLINYTVVAAILLGRRRSIVAS